MTASPPDTSANPRLVSRADQIELLASAVRQELVDTLGALGGEASVSALALHLGRPMDGLYYHLDLLARGGLIREVEVQDERRYRLAGEADHPVRLVYRPGAPGVARALGRFVRSLFQIAVGDFNAALAIEGVAVEGPRRELWAARNKGWVGEAEIEEINTLLRRVCDLTSLPRAPGRERLMTLAFVLAPVDPLPKRRGAEAKGAERGKG